VSIALSIKFVVQGTIDRVSIMIENICGTKRMSATPPELEDLGKYSSAGFTPGSIIYASFGGI
jgi:hypothetical protein